MLYSKSRFFKIRHFFLIHIIISKNKLIQEELEALHKTLHEQQCQFSRYQEEFFQRENQLQKLEEEKVKEMNDLLISK